MYVTREYEEQQVEWCSTTSQWEERSSKDRQSYQTVMNRYAISDRGQIDERPKYSPSYTLRRGRTPGIIEGIDWLSDGRWLAMGTRKRTIHVFAPNPYGGPGDEGSHLLGRVINMAEMVS